MPDTLVVPLQEFKGDMDRIIKLLDVIDELRDFGSVQPSASESEEDFYDAALKLRGSVRSLGSEFPVFSGTLLLFVAGRFEHFVRSSFEALCEAYASKCDKFSQLPEKMKGSLIQMSAEVVTRPSKYGFDEIRVHAVVHNLSENLKAVSGLGPINADCLSITEQNMQPRILADLYKKIGVQSLWVELSKQAKLKMHFELDKDSEVEKLATAALESLMAERNSIAHPNSSPSFPDVQGVRSHVEFLRVLADVLTDVCRVQLLAFRVA